MPESCDISAIISAHREGIRAGISLRSFMECIAGARQYGLSVETIAVLDTPDAATKSLFEQFESRDPVTLEVEFGDQGLARNAAIDNSSGRFIAFLDGDGLWSYNWLYAAYEVCAHSNDTVIAHPEFNWFFDGDNAIFTHIDQDHPDFDIEFMRFGNYWDALCMAPRRAYTDLPFSESDLDNGYAYEDWHWNCMTLAGGYKHKTVKDTIHFKRRRQNSQNIKASKSRNVARQSAISLYASAFYDS